MKKKRLARIIVILIAVVGVALILYPTVSDYLSNLAYSRAIKNFQSTVEKLDPVTYDQTLERARAYNRRKAEKGTGFSAELSDEERADYLSQLDVAGTGIMGYIEILSLNILLPIYHGTADSVLQIGVGHIEGSFLPVGGESTHAVLSGHTGLPSSKLFTDIERLKIGDIFVITVMNEKLTYEVDQILIVLPHETEPLSAVEGQDYCTLVTCTPYGINTHRLLVRGRRVETPEEDTEPVRPDTTQEVAPPQPEPKRNDHLVIIGVAVVCLAAVTLIAVTMKRSRPEKDER